MRKLLFLFPEIDMQQGGHTAQMAFFSLCQQVYPATAVTYKKRASGTPFLADILAKTNNTPDSYIFVLHWGPDIPMLVKTLYNYEVIYIAHSTGRKYKLPQHIPIIAVSRHTQAYWGKHAPKNLIHYLPNIINKHFYNSEQTRSIDVLIMRRKASRYLLEELFPYLQKRCRVHLVDGWVDDISKLMRNSKIFLYDSSEYWSKEGLSEGFGLPPLEALACGCAVFSSINDALSDYLEPGVNCHQIGVHSTQFDGERIIRSLQQWRHNPDSENMVSPWREENTTTRIEPIFNDINGYFDYINSQNKFHKKHAIFSQLFINIFSTH